MTCLPLMCACHAAGKFGVLGVATPTTNQIYSGTTATDYTGQFSFGLSLAGQLCTLNSQTVYCVGIKGRYVSYVVHRIALRVTPRVDLIHIRAIKLDTGMAAHAHYLVMKPGSLLKPNFADDLCRQVQLGQRLGGCGWVCQ